MYQKNLVGCLLLLFVLACNKNKQADVIVDIEDEFYIDIFEDLSSGTPNFLLNITTIKDQTCLNYQIDYNLDFVSSSKSIELVITDLLEPLDCVAGMAPAQLTIPFGNLVPGSYSFDINLKDAVINRGNLTVSDTQYLIEMNSNDGIDLLHNRLNRVPKNTVWGYAAYVNAAEKVDAENAVLSIRNLASTYDIEDNSIYSSGYYGYFNLTEDREVTLNGEMNFDNHVPFVFQHNDLPAIKMAIDEACLQNKNLEIRIFDEKGAEEVCLR